MLQVITEFSVKIVNRYLPSPFIFSVALTFMAFAMGLVMTGQSALELAGAWGNGLWSLHGFAMQMALVLMTGYALANAPIAQRGLEMLAGCISRPTTAIMSVTLVALLGCWLNWGFGLVAGAVFAKSVAKKVKNVDYPLLIASAYSGFLIWHGGLSGSIPLTLSSGGDTLAVLSGGVLTEAVPVSQTIFSSYNLVIVGLLLVSVPLLNCLMHPKTPTLINPNLIKEESYVPPLTNTPAQKLDDSKLVMLLLVAMSVMYYVNEFGTKGFTLGLNVVIGLFLFAGLFFHGSLERYYQSMNQGMTAITGIVLLFPFYSGIMGLIAATDANGMSIGAELTLWFTSVASQKTFALLAFLSAGIVNIFVPSGGGQMAIQGPIMIPAGEALGVKASVTAMAIAWGDAWTNMLQPFWALPLLGMAGLDARAIMGYCLMVLLMSGVIVSGVFYFMT